MDRALLPLQRDSVRNFAVKVTPDVARPGLDSGSARVSFSELPPYGFEYSNVGAGAANRSSTMQ